MSDRLYANIVLRLQALLHDVVLYAVVATLAWILGAVVFELRATAEIIERFALIGFVVLYEPVLVWKFGGTWGHHERNLKVCDQQTGENIGFLRAEHRVRRERESGHGAADAVRSVEGGWWGSRPVRRQRRLVLGAGIAVTYSPQSPQ